MRAGEVIGKDAKPVHAVYYSANGDNFIKELSLERVPEDDGLLPVRTDGQYIDLDACV